MHGPERKVQEGSVEAYEEVQAAESRRASMSSAVTDSLSLRPPLAIGETKPVSLHIWDLAVVSDSQRHGSMHRYQITRTTQRASLQFRSRPTKRAIIRGPERTELRLTAPRIRSRPGQMRDESALMAAIATGLNSLVHLRFLAVSDQSLELCPCVTLVDRSTTKVRQGHFPVVLSSLLS
jgi:hypothetical protein